MVLSSPARVVVGGVDRGGGAAGEGAQAHELELGCEDTVAVARALVHHRGAGFEGAVTPGPRSVHVGLDE